MLRKDLKVSFEDLIRKKHMKESFIQTWPTLIKQFVYLKRLSKELDEKKYLRMFHFIGYFMARRIQNCYSQFLKSKYGRMPHSS